MTRSAQAFTLVELLVVIAILALLALLSFSLIAQVREKARLVQCSNNLMQLHKAATLVYAPDKGQVPHSASTEFLDPADSQWHVQHVGWVTWFNYPADTRTYWWGAQGLACITNGALFPSARETRIYLCPSFARRNVCGRADAVRSYVMNSQVSGAAWPPRPGGSRTILFADGGLHRYLTEGSAANQQAWVGLRGWQNDWQAYDVPQSLGGPAGRQHYVHLDGELRGFVSQAAPYPDEVIGDYHRGRGNVVFLDGSVEAYALTNTLGLCAGMIDR